MNDLFDGLGIEIELNDAEDFLKIAETLTRIGVASKKDKTLYQSCHLLHKQGRYVIIHFKELFELDGKSSNFSEDDEARRNSIAKLLSDWGLLKILDTDRMDTLASMSQIKVLPFKEKKEWNLVPKYTIGQKK